MKPVLTASTRLFATAFLFCGVVGLSAGADNPTREEWTPVKTAIADNAANAVELLEGLTKQYPRWTDGLCELARQYFKQDRPADAEKCANQALGVDPAHAEAGSLSIQAKIAAGRGAEAFALADTFTASTDTKSGYVFYQAALAAFQLGDIGRSEEYLKRAKDHIGKTIPAQFHYLEGRLALRQTIPDVDRAEACLVRAVTSDDKLFDAWYEFGRVEIARADQHPNLAQELLTKADDAFARVLKALPNDYESWLGRGRCQLGLSKIMVDRDLGDGRHQLSEAESCLRHALGLNEQLADAETCLGEVLLKYEKFEEAIEHLQKARALGATDRAVDFNLALAYEKTKRVSEARQVLKRLEAVSPAEKITKGITYYKAGRFESALNLLNLALDNTDITSDPELSGALLRFIGHAWQAWARQLDKQVRKTEDATASEEVQRRTDEASMAYRKAGDLGDTLAQRSFLALECQQVPERAYAAAWSYLAWRGYRSPVGWGAVIGHYGASKAWRNPVHIAIWAVVAVVLLVLWLKNQFRPAATVSLRPRSADGQPITPNRITRERTADAPRAKPAAAPSPLARRKQALQAKTAGDAAGESQRP
jgi:tetratricopeptide (TPR) repeat protein